jgi:hypothetical protein
MVAHIRHPLANVGNSANVNRDFVFEVSAFVLKGHPVYNNAQVVQAGLSLDAFFAPTSAFPRRVLFFAKFSEDPSFMFESHGVACGRTSHLFGHCFQTMIHLFKLPRSIKGGELPTQAVGAYCAPQDDPGSPA